MQLAQWLVNVFRAAYIKLQTLQVFQEFIRPFEIVWNLLDDGHHGVHPMLEVVRAELPWVDTGAI